MCVIIEQFNELLENVKEIIEEIELIKRKALEIHRKYSYETNFIIKYVNNDERIIFIG